MIITNEEQKEVFVEAGRRLRAVLDDVSSRIKPGVSAADLDTRAHTMIVEAGDTPAFLNYKPEGASSAFPATLCVSVNDEMVHGTPDREKVIQDGDIVSIDCGLRHHGLLVDAACTVIAGTATAEARALVDATRSALRSALAVVRADVTTGDIGAAVETVANKHGYTIPPELGGHGIGTNLHEDPFIPNIGDPGEGDVLREGAAVAIEPIFSIGANPHIVQRNGEFAYRTADGARSAHFEHTILVMKEAPLIITGPMW